jgi:hypothetical protein
MIALLIALAITQAGAFEAAELRCDATARAYELAGVPEEEIGGPYGLYEQCMRAETKSEIPLGDGSFWKDDAS